jgi:uncharacterized protein (TIGR02001 family)
MTMFTSIRGLSAATALAGCALAATPALADETAPPAEITVTGNVALVTDYRFRGLSQSSGDPAIQGGITVSHASGFYVGAWSSSTDFDVVGPVADAVYGNQDLDLFGGWTGPVASGVTADVGLLYYAYPSGHVGKAEFFEPYASLSTTLGPVTGKVGLNYAWKQESLNFNGGGKDDSLYVYGEVSAGIPTTPVSVSGHLGYTDGALSPKFATGQTAGYKGGFDWNVGATYAITRNLSVTGQYVGVEGRSIDGYSNDAVVGTLKLNF